jgi:hypothetical protein
MHARKPPRTLHRHLRKFALQKGRKNPELQEATRKVTTRYRNRPSVASVNFRDVVVRFEEGLGREAELG